MAYSSIVKPSVYFDTELWSSVDTSIDTLDFQPDWVWIKSRTNADTQVLFDAVRGVTKRLSSSGDAAESTRTDELTAFNSDGFTIGTGDNVNRASNNYVAWNWKAGGGQGSSNTDGSINTTYTSVNTTAGFSIVTYTGTGSNATIGHGLGVAPKMIIIKARNYAKDWTVYHASLGNGKWLELNGTAAEQTNSNRWNNTSPTNQVFTVGVDSGVNGSGYTYVAYCFAEKTGYSKFGSYTGNGNANGTFVYTGFKPAFVLTKKSSGSGNSWRMFDNKRPGFNSNSFKFMHANLNNAEDSGDVMDLDSNGFKIRTTSNDQNTSGATYIYMSFGQSIVGTNNIPATAR